jgi:hypothetical protein
MPAHKPRTANLDRACAVVREGIERKEAHSAVLAVADAREVIRLEVAAPADGSEAVAADSIFLLPHQHLGAAQPRGHARSQHDPGRLVARDRSKHWTAPYLLHSAAHGRI